MASPHSSGLITPPIRTFRGSRPPSPSVCPGMLDLERVNDKLRRRTASPEIPNAERQREEARNVYDELIEIGGIPTRDWVEFRAEDLTFEERGLGDGDHELRDLYVNEWGRWRTQLKLWQRFAKRRKMDAEPDIRDLEPIDAVAAFIAYLRDQLRSDMEYRAKPGWQRWMNNGEMSMHRSFIYDILETLPEVEALLKALRREQGDDAEESVTTEEGLRKEYDVPDPGDWLDLWWRSLDLLEALEKEAAARKRRRDDGDEEVSEEDTATDDPQASKPPATASEGNTNPNPKITQPPWKKRRGTQQKRKQAPKHAESAAPANSGVDVSLESSGPNPNSKTSAKGSKRTTREPAKRRQKKGSEGGALRTSARIAARSSLQK